MKYFGAHVSAAGGVENAPAERRKDRGDGFRPVYEESAAMVGRAAQAVLDRRVRGQLQGGRIRSGRRPASRQLPDQPGPSQGRGAEEVARCLPRRDAALRAAGARPAELSSGQRSGPDRRRPMSAARGRVDRLGARADPGRDGRRGEHGRAGLPMSDIRSSSWRRSSRS